MHDDELWQEYSTTGEPIPGIGHPKTYYHETHPSAICGTAHVWLYRDTPSGHELLFQLRSPRVINGNTWDISAAGHINLGETPVEAALREALEEIGVTLDPEKLQFAFSFKDPGPHALHNTYLYNYSDQPDNFHFDDGEVADLKWVKLSELDDFRTNGGVKSTLASFGFYWDLLLRHLSHHED